MLQGASASSGDVAGCHHGCIQQGAASSDGHRNIWCVGVFNVGEGPFGDDQVHAPVACRQHTVIEKATDLTPHGVHMAGMHT